MEEASGGGGVTVAVEDSPMLLLERSVWETDKAKERERASGCELSGNVTA